MQTTQEQCQEMESTASQPGSQAELQPEEGPLGEGCNLLGERSLSTFYVSGPVLSTKHQGKQDVVPAQTESTLLYLAVCALLSAQITWLPVKTSDSQPHLPRPMDSRSKDEAWVPLCFTGVSDGLMINEVHHIHPPLPHRALTDNHCLYSICKIEPL